MQLFKKKNKYKQPSEMNFNKRYCSLKEKFYNQVVYELNLENPQTFNEKINWMKLFYHNDEMTRIVDKYEFKNYIREKLGDGYTVPLLGVWDKVEDIDFDKLPKQFVLKSNAQSEGNFIKIIKDKNSIDLIQLKSELKNWLIPYKTLVTSYCWAYNNVKPKIIAEEYIEELENTKSDYKFFCFNGEVKCFYCSNNWVTNRFHDDRTLTYYDLNKNPLPLTYNNYKKSNKPIEDIKNFDKIIELAQILSKDFPFVRVDFYEINNKIYVGEMTFYPGGGYGKYEPQEWDYKLGSWMDLSVIKQD